MDGLKMNGRALRTLNLIFPIALCLLLGACTSSSSSQTLSEKLAEDPNAKLFVEHAFSFDAPNDSRDVEILDYRYGDSGIPATHADEKSRREGRVRQYVNVNGSMLRGDFLYVKWRIKTSGAVFEDTVDLRRGLPADLKDHRIHFIVDGSQLYVYLI